MPRLVVRRCLGVGGETLEEVLLLAVGYVDSCHLNGAVLGLDLAQLINEVTKLLSEFRLPSPSRLRRNLHGDRIELGIVAVGMAFDKRLELVIRCHSRPPSSSSAP